MYLFPVLGTVSADMTITNKDGLRRRVHQKATKT